MADRITEAKKFKNRGIYFEERVYKTKAFLSLKRSSIVVLIAVLDARQLESKKDHKGGGKKTKRKAINTGIRLPYRKLEKEFKLTQQTISKAIDELLEKGFIQIEHQGGRGEHDMSIYSFVENYIFWEPGVIFQKRERDVHRGWQGKSIGVTMPKDV